MFNLLKKTYKSIVALALYTLGVWATLSAIPFFVIVTEAKRSISNKWDTLTTQEQEKLTTISLKLQDLVDLIPELEDEEGEH
jgi:MFS-type transporter involved in bile tolerance (Atg22 family)